LNKNIKLFNDWAIIGKDKGMEDGHADSVTKMLSLIPDSIISKKFNFIDYGCGNGWVVKNMSSHINCSRSVGLDGAEEMIKKAKKKDAKGVYYNVDIENWNNDVQYDIVFSMEFFYYLNNPLFLIQKIFDKVLKDQGFFVIGVDHYLENTSSLSWGSDLDLDIKTLSKKEWKDMFMESGFKNVNMFCYGAKNQWEGTLIIYASK
tara:strand:+ start:678 stop:1289 length:612 start_codon:yes stop_codon:yes gene_type:complete